MKPPAKCAKVLGVCLLTGTAASQQQHQPQQPLVVRPSVDTVTASFNSFSPSMTNTASPSFNSLSPSFNSLSPSITNTASPSFHSLSPSFNSLRPSLAPISAQPPLVPVGQVALGGGNINGASYASCAAIGRASIPGCAMECFATGAAALGCAVHDLGCQCRQQARMMAAAEGCVAETCPGAAYQRVIDGAMSMCGCAVGVATAEVSGLIARPGPTGTASVSASYSYMSGSGFSVVPSLTVINNAASGTATPSFMPQVDPPSQMVPIHKRGVEEDHEPPKSFDTASKAAIQASSGTSPSHYGNMRVSGWVISVLPTLLVGLIV
ncbi:hypothetical protein PspLS_02653 [Pyricularia sp. CBS 133598]|nr:hypothetical protein PspLS_02653 [Pyricularia sp. CBS 133598]